MKNILFLTLLSLYAFEITCSQSKTDQSSQTSFLEVSEAEARRAACRKYINGLPQITAENRERRKHILNVVNELQNNSQCPAGEVEKRMANYEKYLDELPQIKAGLQAKNEDLLRAHYAKNPDGSWVSNLLNRK